LEGEFNRVVILPATSESSVRGMQNCFKIVDDIITGPKYASNFWSCSCLHHGQRAARVFSAWSNFLLI